MYLENNDTKFSFTHTRPNQGALLTLGRASGDNFMRQATSGEKNGPESFSLSVASFGQHFIVVCDGERSFSRAER
jgi:hypothetical protein